MLLPPVFLLWVFSAPVYHAPVRKGVELYDPEDHAATRRRIEQGTIREFERAFPVSYGGVRIEVLKPRMDGKDHVTIEEQKKALMLNRNPARRLKADLRLYDEETGKLLDKRDNFTLMRVPFYTDRGVFQHNGNEYTGITQVRMIPGAYTRRRNTGDLETQFNVRSGTGKVFRVGMRPDTGQFRLKVAGSDLHLYSILRDLGVPDSDLEGDWGAGVLEANRTKYDSQALDKAWRKLVPAYIRKEDASQVEKASQVREALVKAQVAETALSKTLAGYWPEEVLDDLEKSSMLRRIVSKAAGAATAAKSYGYDVREQGDEDDEGDKYRSVGIGGLRASTRKILAVNRGQDVTDERNSPAFLKVFPIDKLLSERVRLDEGRIRRKILRRLASRKNLDAFPVRAFDDYHLQFITKNPLTTALEETNPLHLVDQHRRMTQMGPGGIGSSNAITPEMQNIQAAEFGFLSPLAGPESEMAGVDTRLAWGARFGSDGRIYQRFRNRRTGKIEWMSPEELYDKTVKIPD